MRRLSKNISSACHFLGLCLIIFFRLSIRVFVSSHRYCTNRYGITFHNRTYLKGGNLLPNQWMEIKTSIFIPFLHWKNWLLNFPVKAWLSTPSAPFHGALVSLGWPVISSGDQLLSLPFICSVVSNSAQSHGLQHTRLPCPSLYPRVCSDSVRGVGDAIQPSHPLLLPAPPALRLS